jgi:hypothetical protein
MAQVVDLIPEFEKVKNVTQRPWPPKAEALGAGAW